MNPKKKILIIGSSVADVIMNVKKLPAPGEDVHILNQRLCIGGCAFNVSDMIRHFQVPHLLFSPAGTGIYGDFVREEWEKRGIVSVLPVPDLENGCYYAPGPRIEKQPKDLMYRLFALHPVVHLNQSESFLLTGKTDTEHAARAITRLTGQDVVITLGKDGAYCLENGTGVFLPSRNAKQVDATGAGDAHIGAVMALRKLGFSLSHAVGKANLVSAAVVKKKGASLDHSSFLRCFNK